MDEAFSVITRHQLGYQLTPISVRELLFINQTPCEIFGLEKGLFKSLMSANSLINTDILRELIKQGQIHLFVYHSDRPKLIEHIQTSLINVTRSLSVGDPVEKGKKQMNLLTINMGYLYQNPTNDEFLKLQLQSAKNLAYFLMDKVDILEPLYQAYIKQKHHFIFAQPLLSSIFVLGVLKYSQTFSDAEIENLFITSYFKDIGMSAIPTEKYDKDDLSDVEKELLANHAASSVNILRGRLPLAPNHLTIIQNHHSFSLLTNELASDILGGSDNVISGFETMIISVMDIIAAMISGRPFRKATSLFESLDLIKILVADQYPQEFRLIIGFFRQFFLAK